MPYRVVHWDRIVFFREEPAAELRLRNVTFDRWIPAFAGMTQRWTMGLDSGFRRNDGIRSLSRRGKRHVSFYLSHCYLVRPLIPL